MSKIIFGEVDWNSKAADGGGGKTQFMRLDPGRNVIRVMGNPVQFYINWVTEIGRCRVQAQSSLVPEGTRPQ